MKAFANNLKTARRIKGWSQDKAAEMLGMGRPSYGAWEEGRARPKYEAQLILVEVFGIKDWKQFCENENFDPIESMKPTLPEISASFTDAMRINYNRADIKTRLAVNILLGLVEVE